MTNLEFSNSNSKITLSVLSVLLFSFLLVIFFMNTYSSSIADNKIAFYHQDFDASEKKLFLVGSSDVAQINEVFIQNFIFDSKSNYKIYNLGYGEDKPAKRLAYINDIISAKPEIVVYGISFRDFANFTAQAAILRGFVDPDSQNEHILPEPEIFYKNIERSIGSFLNLDYENLKYPQQISRSIIHKSISSLKVYETTVYGATPTKPFWPIFGYLGTILNDEQLRDLYARQCEENHRGCSLSYEPINPEKNENFSALKEIIKKLKENDIQVIVYSSPFGKNYLDSMRESDKQIFATFLSIISNEFDIPVYQLHDKYTNEQIWYDNSHFAQGNSEILPNVDIGQIILDELKNVI